jgi:hypothetical protein
MGGQERPPGGERLERRAVVGSHKASLPGLSGSEAAAAGDKLAAIE